MVTLLLATALFALPAADLTPENLWEIWPDQRFVSTPAPCLRPAELEAELERLAAKYPDTLRLEEIGRSVLDRPIYLMTLGTGPRKVFLWSQMHGDEPSATPALLDIVDYLLSEPDRPDRRAILEGTTLLMIPMLNPDGSEVYERRNAQGIDINRDALSLATPEGRLLKRIRDEHEPMLGFNLHDQGRRTSVGDTGKLATNAVLAVAGDKEGTVTPGRLLAKRASSAIVEALAPFMPGGMARYDEDWSPRAFGDNITAWGTPVVLIESGGLPPGRDFTELTRLNFVAILATLRDLVKNDLADHDPEIYEQLERNESNLWSDIAIRNGRLLQPGLEPYRADLSINLQEDDRLAAGCPDGRQRPSRIAEVGDSRFIAASRDVDATGSLVMPPLTVEVDGYAARRWLDGETLDRLARLGVAQVRWVVADRQARDARRHILQLAGEGRPRVVLSDHSKELPRVDRRPELPPSRELAAVLTALVGERIAAGGVDRATLERFWPRGEDDAPEIPALRTDIPASFLVVESAESGDLGAARLRSVWIDGVEVAPAR